MAAGKLTDAQAMAIRYLVALAVADLDPEQVAVIDSRAGMVLAPGADTPVAGAAGEAAEREAKLKAEIEQLLAARVGRDRSRVTVAVETDREAETVTEKVIQPDSRITIHSDTEEVSDSSTGTASSVTVASNLPDGEGGGDTRSASRSETRERVNYDYSEVQRQRVRQAGAIRRISVAVLVDGIASTGPDGQDQWAPRPLDELRALRDLVIAAVGYDEQRGDIVTVESMRFQPDATPGVMVEVSSWQRLLERNAMTLIQIGVLGAVAMILALVVVRPILARPAPPAILSGPEALADMSGAGNAALAKLARPDGGQAAGGGNLLPAPGQPGEAVPAPSGETLRLAVTERPEQAVSMLREWLDSADGEAA
jgi:flagellar M-ring protein FliF